MIDQELASLKVAMADLLVPLLSRFWAIAGSPNWRDPRLSHLRHSRRSKFQVSRARRILSFGPNDLAR
ncbi:unnamed protein product [Lupinus luteus]|uniref:Uncharacterized protein n=1 Tax=Lupinus luteus TaxID=3873 RepID=A0AAV1WYM1_LUPLU